MSVTALVLAKNFPPQVGGSCNYYRSIYERLSPGSAPAVSIRWPGDLDFDARFPHHVTRFAVARSRWLSGRWTEAPDYLCWLKTTLRALRSWRPSVLHCGEALPTGLVGLALKAALGYPYVVFVHGEELTTTTHLRYQSHALRQVLRRADWVIAACSMARAEAEAIAGEPLPATVILPGVDLQRFSPSTDISHVVARYGLAGHAVLLTVGRLEGERKGHDIVLQALPRILDRVPHALYVIAGDGARAGTLRVLASRLRITHAVRFLGRVPDAALPQLYAAARVFVMPNRALDNGDTEGFGMVFLEASAAGTPVIGGNCGGTADSILDGTTGFRVSPTDPAEVADSVIRLLTDAALAARMGREARAFAESGFDWATRAEQVWDITVRLASRRAA